MIDRLAAGALAALTLLAVASAWHSIPATAASGMLLAAVPPAGFILARMFSGRLALASHPLPISIVSGLGCVIALVAEQRFGTPAWTIAAALAGLVVWMLWQRQARRRNDRRDDTMPTHRQRIPKS